MHGGWGGREGSGGVGGVMARRPYVSGFCADGWVPFDALQGDELARKQMKLINVRITGWKL